MNHESQITERNKSIASLLENINELSSIFKELQTVDKNKELYSIELIIILI